MIGIWLVAMVWLAWVSQAALGDWVLARTRQAARLVRAAPTSAALFGLSDRWTALGGRFWLRYGHERVCLGARGLRGGGVELPLDQPCAVSPGLIVSRK